MSPFPARTISYGRVSRAWRVSSASNLRPTSLLTAKTVFIGLVIAWRLAICPTRRSWSSVKPTIDGVVRLPSRLAMTRGLAPSTTATQQFVVPRSIPRILLIGGTRSRKTGNVKRETVGVLSCRFPFSVFRVPALTLLDRDGDLDEGGAQELVVQEVAL